MHNWREQIRWIVLIEIFTLLQTARSADDAYFSRKVGQYFGNHVIHTVKTGGELDCGHNCLREDKCVSVNYKVKGHDKGLCELNSETHEELSENAKNDEEYVYLGIVQRTCKANEEFSTKTKKCKAFFHSCKDVQSTYGNSSSGLYTLKSITSDEYYQVYCHMTNIQSCGDGGWTLVMKVNGTEKTFMYNSPLWTNKETYAEQDGIEGLVNKESKLASYWSTPFTNVCLGMTHNGVTKWLKLNYTASSLYNVLADGQYRPTTAGRSAWKSLIAGSSLQKNCNREGFNVQFNDNKKMRIGIVANNENNCLTCDSWLGFRGTTNRICGNFASSCCSPDNGQKDVLTFGYILVQ